MIWILVGTTTFFSLVIFTLNTVSAQDYFARFIGNLVTKETGTTVVFENAIVPHWKDGVIMFRNVFVSKRPNSRRNSVQKGSREIAAAAALEANNNNDGDEGNYTQFDLTMDSVSVTLSLQKWMDGKGILKDVEVKGIRGVVDRRHVKWDLSEDHRKYKNVRIKLGFEIENFNGRCISDLIPTRRRH